MVILSKNRKTGRNSAIGILFTSIIVVLCFLTTPSTAAQLTRIEATLILTRDVIGNFQNKECLMAYGPQTVLTAGDVVEPAFLGGQPYPGESVTIEPPTWFFYINNNVMLKFTHQVHFVFIDANHQNPTIGDGIRVLEQGWWPVLNGKSLYTSDSPDNPDWIYGDIPELLED